MSDLPETIGRSPGDDSAPQPFGIRYVTKQATVRAIRWQGTVESATVIIDWVLERGGTARYVDYAGDRPYIAVRGGVSDTHCFPGDYVVQGPTGWWARNVDDFERTFEEF